MVSWFKSAWLAAVSSKKVLWISDLFRGLYGTSILTGVRKRCSVDRMEMRVVIVGTFAGMDKSSRG